jgi:hypothetical protein
MFFCGHSNPLFYDSLFKGAYQFICRMLIMRVGNVLLLIRLKEKKPQKKVPRRNSGDFFVKEESTYF